MSFNQGAKLVKILSHHVDTGFPWTQDSDSEIQLEVQFWQPQDGAVEDSVFI